MPKKSESLTAEDLVKDPVRLAQKLGLPSMPPEMLVTWLVGYVDEVEAGKLDGYSRAWHQRARWKGEGPEYVKKGATVRYQRLAILKWMLEAS